MINAAIAKGCNNGRNETESVMMDKLANQVQCAGNAFKHMDDSVGNAAAKSTIQNLCKSWRIGFFFISEKVLASLLIFEHTYILMPSGLGNSIARGRFCNLCRY